MKPLIRVDIVSDVVCPWCFIGKRRIEKAMRSLKEDFNFEITFLPFELNPNIPKEGLNQKDYLVKKFGGEEKYNQITAHVSKIAFEEGLQFNFDIKRVAPNTRDAHRLLWFAREKGKQVELKELLMQAYFVKGVDLTIKDNLISLAVQAGLDKDEVTSLIESSVGIHEVSKLEQLNIQRGISGVPFFIISNQYGVSGAQPVEVFIQTLTQIGNSARHDQTEAGEVK